MVSLCDHSFSETGFLWSLESVLKLALVDQAVCDHS